MTEDNQYEETTIRAVRPAGDGWEITRADGWSFFVPNSPITPKEGDICRFYGEGTGFQVRGLVINGTVIFYRTAEEQKEHSEHALYGTTPQDILDRWDAGEIIHTIEMGGLGPGYEQAIHVAAMEVLRQFIAEKPDCTNWVENGFIYDYISTSHNKIKGLPGLGLSGAQWSAAVHVASRLYKDGPRQFVKSIPENRKIMVSNRWPRLSEESDAA